MDGVSSNDRDGLTDNRPSFPLGKGKISVRD